MKVDLVRETCSAWAAKTALQALTKVRRYPERFHTITNIQYASFQDNRKYVGWNAGIIYDKPWFIVSWLDEKNNQMLGCMISDKKIENNSISSVVDIFTHNNIFRLDKYFEAALRNNSTKPKDVFFEKRDEGANGNFFKLVLKIRDGKVPNYKYLESSKCTVSLAPIDALIGFNKEYKEKPFEIFDYQKTEISNTGLANAIDILSDIRIFPNKYKPLTDIQWMDLGSEDAVEKINGFFDNLFPIVEPKDILVGGKYPIKEIDSSLRMAKISNDNKTLETLGKLRAEWKQNVQKSLRTPKTKIKKILGWNVGRFQEISSVPWFSICYQDTLDRIMMCTWVSKASFEKGIRAEKIDAFLQTNSRVYSTEENFVYVLPSESPEHFTFSVQFSSREPDDGFVVVHTILQENAGSPCICHASFCPVESLNQLNNNIQISEKPFNKITEGYELTNTILKHINATDVALAFYDTSSHVFSIITKEKEQKQNLIKRSKNILINQTSFTKYQGTYGTQELLPDNLMWYFESLLDDNDIRKAFNTETAVFALDGRNGYFVPKNGWTTINLEPMHLMIAPWFREEYLDCLDEVLRFYFDPKYLYSNYSSDLIACWKEIVCDYTKKQEELISTTSLEDFSYDNIIAYVEPLDGHIEFAYRENGEIKLYQTTIRAASTFKTFLDNEMDKCNNTIDQKYRGWKTFKDGAGRLIAIRLADCYDHIFTPTRIRNQIVGLKLKQFNENNPNILCALVLQYKDYFFTDDRHKKSP